MTSVATLGSSQITSELSQVEARLQKPVTNLDNQITTDKADISAWGNISGAISTLASSLAGIKDVSTINNRVVTSTSTSVATASAAIGATVGTYSLTDVTLAKTQELYSGLLASGAATLTGGAGSLSFTLKSGKTDKVTVGSGSLTLNGVAAAINKAAGGVQASVVGTATGARLVLQSSSTGSSQAFSVTGTGALAQFSYASGSAGTTEIRSQKAVNAALSLNGVPITSKTNTLGSAVSGLTITLTGSGNSTLTVSSAPTELSSAVSSVATSLNSAIAAIAKEIKYVPASTATSSASATAAQAGPLLGNFTATNLSNQLLSAVSGAAASGVSAAGIGLSVSKTGAVTFDSSTFATAYAKSPTAVQALVTQLYTSLEGISTGAIGGGSGSATSTSTGSIGAQTAALNGVITSINTQITEIDKENTAQIDILIQEYTAAENAQTAASITQSYLDIFTNSSGTSSG